MLKTTIVKAGFFGHGALFIAVAPMSSNQSSLEPISQNNTQIVQPINDSTKLISDATAVYGSGPTIRLNKTASQFAEAYIQNYGEDLALFERRGAKYFPIIEKVFAAQKLPLELKYLACVESELKATATSRVGAKGPWQLMPETAKDYGLKMSGKVDERTHYYKSTVAAGKYIKSLYNEFGDWLLVLAAYNSGSGTVQRAIKKAGTRNYWKLQSYLPAETRGHVKRFIAIHKHFQPEGSVTMLTKREAAEFQKEVDLYQIRLRLAETKRDTVIIAAR